MLRAIRVTVCILVAQFASVVAYGNAIAAQDGKYCLADFCIGDTLEQHYGDLQWTFVGKEQFDRLPNPYCARPGQPYGGVNGVSQRPDMKIIVSYYPNFRRYGEPTMHYYTVGSISVEFPAPLRQQEYVAEAKRLLARYGRMKPSPPSGYEMENVFEPGDTLSLQTLFLNRLELSYRARTEAATQPGCAVKAPRGL